MIILTYFAFTSLTTVGFGDYVPKADEERLFIAMVLLFGVATFSYVMGNFVNILSQANIINSDIDQSEDLAKFFGLLA
jgi:hypothetical protein